MSTFVELCCGTASVSLWALASLRPLTGYMGSKRSDAALLVRLLGARKCGRIVLVDGGPWGDVWATLQHQNNRRAVAARLRLWGEAGTLPEVWPYLVGGAPPEDPVARAAQYLCLQARAAGCIPVWWSPKAGRWESPSGSRTETAHQRGGCGLASRMKPVGRKVGKAYRSHPARGLVRIETLAERVESLDRIDWTRVDVVHGDIATVIVSEAEPLPLEGWITRRLRESGKPEWLTMSAAPAERVPEQLELITEDAA